MDDGRLEHDFRVGSPAPAALLTDIGERRRPSDVIPDEETGAPPSRARRPAHAR
ncbi:hypothetical protein ACFXKW_29315 [Streptomyces sp. NPDC059193]|uniref:hypothetical protein n=1 Tax=Streptomyces sp. NPDC059193 TaxID=3346763 RepID=UPI003688A707